MNSDDPTRLALEGLARAVDRRSFLRRVSQLGIATAIASVWGSLASVGLVAASHGACLCHFPGPNHYSCGSLGYGCPGAGGCPSGCELCSGCECSDCCYASGWWYSCGCGSFGLGCHKCYDCICPAGAGCGGRCGCRSTQCFCCQCQGPQDIANELAGVRELKERAA